AIASDLKNSCPTWQVAGRAVPTCTGRVEGRAEKSILLLCVLKSTSVWPKHDAASSNASHRRRYLCLMKSSALVGRVSPCIEPITQKNACSAKSLIARRNFPELAYAAPPFLRQIPSTAY